MDSSRSRRGQSAIEVLVALALLGIFATASAVLLSTAAFESRVAGMRARANALLQEGFEAARQVRDQDFDLLADGPHGLALSMGIWSFAGTEDVTDGRFHRAVTVADAGAGMKDVTVSVSWTPVSGRPLSLSGVTRLTDWRLADTPTGSNCYDTLATGDWTHPVSIGSADLGPGNAGTDVVVRYPYAFVSGVASSANKPDLFVYDVSNPASPQLIKSLDIGSDGINALSLSGDSLYAASSNDAKELMVFDTATPATTALIATLNLSGDADAITVHAVGDLLVVGRALSSASEVVFYDVANPASPSGLASFQVADAVNDFANSEQYLFAVSDSETEDVTVFDITDPLVPAWAATYDLPDGSPDFSVAYEPPGTLFIGNAASQFVTVDASDPLAMQMLSATGTGGEVRDMACLTGNLLFIGTNNSTQEFMILDIEDLEAIGQYSNLNFPQVATGVDIANGLVYVAVRSNDALRIIGPGP
ncbi:prepilin-type N-terminal cleavage/methylation domain-containing protein [Patescibacteria group bacterium]|nr:MAG: prepilin-type N-terminal cleavage/methylation domain-containing protein [Patescibacteria group bacterium]